MAQKIIGEDAAIQLKIGTPNNSGVIVFGSYITVTCTAQKITIDDSVELVNTKALCDARKKFRSHSGSSKIDIDLLVNISGFGFLLNSRATPIGLVCRVEVLEQSGLSTPVVFIGIIESWKGEISTGTATMEKLSITCDADATFA